MEIGNMLGSMGVIAFAVIACLVALSIYSVAVILAKFRRFRVATKESYAFAESFAGFLKAGKFNDAAKSARQHGRSHVARVVCAGVDELSDNTTNDPNTRVEMVTRALERSSTRTLAEMRNGLGALATIGSTAPFIGLFGTIIGIVHAFQGIASSGSGGVAAVSSGIAEALIATALGILVAIPAVMAFNYFVSRLESFHIEIETTSAEFVDFLQKRAHATS